jgi:hypothetical protein
MSAISVAMLLGLLLGARHALEPDHLAAVSTMVAQRRGLLACALVGAMWGLGHGAGMTVFAGAAWVLGAELPQWLGAGLELAVALMLVGLGLQCLKKARFDPLQGEPHEHEHAFGFHTHGGPAHQGHLHVGRWTILRRPLLVGLMHGAAGSGAMIALVVTRMPTPLTRVAYMLSLGLGGVVGMAALAAVAGWSFGRMSAASRLSRAIQGAAGIASVGTGALWALEPIGHLFA